jgi:hypothetical protein
MNLRSLLLNIRISSMSLNEGYTMEETISHDIKNHRNFCVLCEQSFPTTCDRKICNECINSQFDLMIIDAQTLEDDG